jgi:single-strand DNA-binding protein
LQNGTQVPERTEWHNLVLWRGLAETAEKYVHKGDKLYIEGKLKTRSYDDQNGVKRYITEIFVDVMEMLTPKGSNSNAQQPQQPQQPQYAGPKPANSVNVTPQEPKEDLPF